MAAVYHMVKIYPYPLTNLSVKQENISCTIIDNGTYYTTEDVGDGIDFTISCDEYTDKTFSAGSYTLYIGNLYAWTTNDYYDISNHTKPLTIYTASATPSVGDTVYTQTGEIFNGRCWTGTQTGKVASSTVNSISNNTITLNSK